jgi:hypothetical protein
LSLNAENFQQLTTQGIPWLSLAQAFKDVTILLTKLGFRFIWIDALCIVQDDLHHKMEEIERMASIYSGSNLVVANAHAVSPDVGLFSDCEQARAQGYLVSPPGDVWVRRMLTHPKYSVSTILSQLSDWNNEQTAYLPLMTRAWTMQELFLAPRILMFTRWEVLWECQDSTTCQCECPLYPRHAFAPIKNVTFKGEQEQVTKNRRMIYDSASDVEILEYWTTIVRGYAGRRITYTSDRCSAILGIATEVATGLKDVFVAGVFKKHIHYSLSWIIPRRFDDSIKATGTRPDLPAWTWFTLITPDLSTIDRFIVTRSSWPSWSWLSTQGSEGTLIDGAVTDAREFKVQEDTVISVDMLSSRHILRVSGVLTELPITLIPSGDNEEAKVVKLLFFDDFQESLADLWWDRPPNLDRSFESEHMYCIELGQSERLVRSKMGNKTMVATTFLVLQAFDYHCTKFVRKGLMQTCTKVASGFLNQTNLWQEKTSFVVF